MISEVKDDEIILNHEISEENLEKLLKFIKETDKYKDLQFVNKVIDVKVRKHSNINACDTTRSESTMPLYPDNGKMQQTIDEHELLEELGVSQEKRRRALRAKDFEILQEDELNTKVQLMRTSLKIWLHEERIHKTQWLRHQKPNQMNFFERI